MIKKNILKIVNLLSLTVLFSCSSLNKNIQTENTITGSWTGNYSWNCKEKGNIEITFNIIDKNGILSGSTKYLGSNYILKGYRLKDAFLGEWRYEKGYISSSGKNIIIDILKSKNATTSINTFSGKLEKNIILGITQNGEKCSTFEGPSGNFKISKK